MGGARALNIAVAGGGIGGITAALMLAKSGHRVTLHEKSDRLGGRLCFEELGRFRIDQGPTIVLLPDMPLELLREAGVDTSRISLLPCDPMYKIHYPDGAVFEKWHNEDRQLAELTRLFPADTDGYRRYMQEHDESFPLGKQAFLDRPFLSTRQAFTTANIRLLLKMRAYRSVRARAAAYFQDPRLADAYSLQTLYIGGAPRRTPALYSFIPYAEQRFGVWYVKGGYASLLPVLQEAMAAAGVEMKLRSTVTRIVVEEGSVKGLETQDGFLPYDKVIYNGDLRLPVGISRHQPPMGSFRFPPVFSSA
jgi:phytoene desaturase